MDIGRVLEKERFVLKKLGEIDIFDDSVCYNAVVSAYHTKFVDYREQPYKGEVEHLLSRYFKQEEIDSFFEKLEEEDVMILKIIGGGCSVRL